MREMNEIITDKEPGKRRTFIIRFPQGHISPAMIIEPDGDPQEVIERFGLLSPRPTLFITGGASHMSDEHIRMTRRIIDEGIAAFAEAHNCTVVDGGTEAGVMQMMGEARMNRRYKFPLVGVAPLGKVGYPGWDNPNQEAVLEDGHSHFVLVKGDEWGAESGLIVALTKAIAQQAAPVIGILINGGRIAEQEVYLATSRDKPGDPSIPILVLDGSGRAADTIGSAYKTGRTNSALVRSIIAGGDIRLTALTEGPDAMRQALEEHFQQQGGN